VALASSSGVESPACRKINNSDDCPINTSYFNSSSNDGIKVKENHTSTKHVIEVLILPWSCVRALGKQPTWPCMFSASAH